MIDSDFFFGIDFGTTNSSIVLAYKNDKEIIYDYYGDKYGEPYPSLVAINDEGDFICGRNAWERRREFEDNNKFFMISSVKSYLGTDKTWFVGGKEWTPEEITAKILDNIKKENDIGGEDIEVVASIPVGFDRNKRKQLKKAAFKSGINIKNFIKESTAIFFKCYEKVKHYSKIAVFDWGGGTLDISVLENNKGEVNELAINNLQIGGDDIDKKIAKMIHSKLKRDKGVDVKFENMDAVYQDMMLVQTEKAKRDLSIRDNTKIAIPKYGDFGAVNADLNIDMFEVLIQKEINQAIQTMDEALNEANLSIYELECVIMAGGTSNIRPLIKEMKAKWNDQEIIYPDKVEWKCAEGAALLSMNPGKYKLNQDIGLILSDNTFFVLRKKNDEIPSKKQVFEFGLTEDSKNARFIFATRNKKGEKINKLACVNVNTFGFLDERLELNVYIDKDFIFHSTIKSSKKADKDKTKWNYNKLKLYYELPEILEGV